MENDLKLIQVGLVLLSLYGILILGKFHPVHFKALLAIGGLLAVMFAYVEAMGLTSYLGINIAGPHNVIPFLLLGIGLDDMFVLIACVPIAPAMEAEHKIEKMMRREGVSITITSLTSFLAFAFGALSSLPALSNFCWTTCFGILFTYLNQLTFFAVLLYYDQKRI